MGEMHLIIATERSIIIFAERQNHHLPVRANIIIFDVWHTNVLIAPISDKNRLK